MLGLQVWSHKLHAALHAATHESAEDHQGRASDLATLNLPALRPRPNNEAQARGQTTRVRQVLGSGSALGSLT
jgi:hypothetical protein